MHKPDEGRPDFMAMPAGAARMDGLPMKPVSSWDADEATRLKSSMMNREKMVSSHWFHFMSEFVAGFLCWAIVGQDRLQLVQKRKRFGYRDSK